MIWINGKYISFHHILSWVNPYQLASTATLPAPSSVLLLCFVPTFSITVIYICHKTSQWQDGLSGSPCHHLEKTYFYLQLNANTPEIQYIYISLCFPKLSFSYCQACFSWAPWSLYPLIAIALSLGPMASSCSPQVLKLALFFSWHCPLNKYEGPDLIHEYSVIILLHSITLMFYYTPLSPRVKMEKDKGVNGS